MHLFHSFLLYWHTIHSGFHICSHEKKIQHNFPYRNNVFSASVTWAVTTRQSTRDPCDGYYPLRVRVRVTLKVPGGLPVQALAIIDKVALIMALPNSHKLSLFSGD